MPPDIIAALIGLLGILIGAMPTFLFMQQKQQKGSAEIEKLRAEAEKAKAETERIRVEILMGNNKSSEQTTSIALERQVSSRPVQVYNVQLIVRDQVDMLIGSVQQRLENAKSEVRISGNDNKFVAESCSTWVRETLSRGVSIKILCTNPKSPAVSMLPKIDPRYPAASAFVDSMESVEKELCRIKKDFPKLFEFRYLPILPAMGFFITDPTSNSGVIKVEFYVAKPYKPLNSRPHIIIPQESVEWREYFLTQWNNYWQMSKEPE